MRMFSKSFGAIAFAILSLVISAQGASITGIVTNKTTNKPSASDTVVLIDVGAGMSEAASATTDGEGRYSLEAPSAGPYLIRVNHQGGTYFIAAPQGGGSGDVNVYDVAAKVDGVSIDADMFLVEAAGGMLRIHERYLVRNTSLPPRAQFSANTFEIEIPSDAEIDSASATRPGGLATNTRLTPLEQKGHYTFNIPIQPNQGEKETLFEVQYHLSYNGRYTLTPHPKMPVDNVVVYLPQGIELKGTSGASFQTVQEDPKVQSYVAKNIRPGQTIDFAFSGEGQMPRSTQGPTMGQATGMGNTELTGELSAQPGGGIGAPIGTPDPLTKYKWWILSLLTLVLITASAYLIRKKEAGGEASKSDTASHLLLSAREALPTAFVRTPAQSIVPPTPPARDTMLLELLKDEMFAIESEKLAGRMSEDAYARIKVGLDALLKRILGRTEPTS